MYMYLPGIRATIECRHNTGYVVTALVLEDGYKQVGKRDNKPGIYSVRPDQDSLEVKYNRNGQIKGEDNRYVIICESGYKTAKAAAEDVVPRLEKLASRDVAQDKDFDIMFSSSGLKGMRNFDPTAITDAYAASSILASAMVRAKSRKVQWVSDFGGSVMLTQSMAIIAQQNEKLEKHRVRMFKPSSDSTKAYHLALQIGAKVGSDFTTGGGIRGSISASLTKIKRIANRDDSYSLKDGAKDAAQSGLTGVSVVGVGLFVATLPATSGPLAVAGAVTSGIGAIQLLWTKAKNIMERPKK